RAALPGRLRLPRPRAAAGGAEPAPGHPPRAAGRAEQPDQYQPCNEAGVDNHLAHCDRSCNRPSLGCFDQRHFWVLSR
ncbi:unnamed protein product, partial [Heterosigma akashiwo]